MKKTYSIRLNVTDIKIIEAIGKAMKDDFKQQGLDFKVTRSGVISGVLFSYALKICEERKISLNEFTGLAEFEEV